MVSGGSAPFRAAVIHGILRQYAAQGVPTVVLHCGSPWLSCGAAAGAVLPGGQRFRCDPLLGSSPGAAAELLTDLSGSLSPGGPPLGGLWDLLLEVLALKDGPVTLSALCAGACRDLPEELARLSRKGALDSDRACALRSRTGRPWAWPRRWSWEALRPSTWCPTAAWPRRSCVFWCSGG